MAVVISSTTAWVSACAFSLENPLLDEYLAHCPSIIKTSGTGQQTWLGRYQMPLPSAHGLVVGICSKSNWSAMTPQRLILRVMNKPTNSSALFCVCESLLYQTHESQHEFNIQDNHQMSLGGLIISPISMLPRSSSCAAGQSVHFWQFSVAISRGRGLTPCNLPNHLSLFVVDWARKHRVGVDCGSVYRNVPKVN